MQPEQRSMTVIAPVLRGREQSLKDLLTAIGSDIEGNTHIQFAKFPEIHFARWAVIPPPDTQAPAGPPSQLVFGTDHDGPDEALIGVAVAGMMDALDAIYSHCDGWPGPGDKEQGRGVLLAAAHSLRCPAHRLSRADRPAAPRRRPSTRPHGGVH